MTMTPAPARYREAGVDIPSKYEAVERAKEAIRRSFTPGVIGDVGSFGGLFDLARAGARDALLVASADGVGTKLEVAKRAGVYDTVGRDLVHHCIDDILVQGARPLFFMDYVAVGRMEPVMVSQLIRGCADACQENGLALLGGETAEMPGLYVPGDFDLAGFIVGAVAREKLLDGSRVRAGQVLLGLRSSGLHTNGYSLARRILFDELGLSLSDRPDGLEGRSVGEELLAVHRSYFRLLWPLLEKDRIAAMAHITGGGLVDNLPRVLNGCDAWIDRRSWEPPALFRFLCDRGRVGADEAYQVFNMGIGMVLVVEPELAGEVERHLRSAGEEVFVIGKLERSTNAARAEGGADVVAGNMADIVEGEVRWIS
jgi:phosphoribosylformylglycinamidine cyclo-ligase